MESNSGLQMFPQYLLEQYSTFQCHVCGMYLNSTESLNVHLQYHKENLLKNFDNQAGKAYPRGKANNNIKREVIENNTYHTDNCNVNIQRDSPEYTTTSPYQNDDTFSSNLSNCVQVKPEAISPNSEYEQNGYSDYSNQQFISLEQDPQGFTYTSCQNSIQAQVTSSVPDNSMQPIPLSNPEHCDRCGCVFECTSQLKEHISIAHSASPVLHLSAYNVFNQPPIVNTQSEILDLDSHKVVNNIFLKEDKRESGNANYNNLPPVSSMLNSWPPQRAAQHEFNQGYVVTSSPDDVANTMNQFRQFSQASTTFGHSPLLNVPAISSTQVSNPQSPPGKKNKAKWKSDRTRREKTHECPSCNKWFTSSGHLKRHYTTMLHKNAVKASGNPDPALLPNSVHHISAKKPSKRGMRLQSGNSSDENKINATPPTLQQQVPSTIIRDPSDIYDSQPAPNIEHLQPPMGPQNLFVGCHPNGEAGLSTSNLYSRGLLSVDFFPINSPIMHQGFNVMPQPMMTLESSQFNTCPNMATNNNNTTGENQNCLIEENKPLPSFEEIQVHHVEYVDYEIANMRSGGLATAPYTTFYPNDMTESETLSESDYNLRVLTTAEPTSTQEKYVVERFPPNHINGHALPMVSDMNTNLRVIKNVKDDITLKQILPKPQRKPRKKKDHEEQTGCPIISSTVPTKQVKHKCYECDKTFNKACYLTQHNRTFHCGVKPFKCVKCGKRFSCEETYQDHLKKHAGDKPHKCHMCIKQFNHKTDLRRHMCLHTGKKPFTCDTCGKGFIRKDHMMKHFEIHIRKNQMKLAGARGKK